MRVMILHVVVIVVVGGLNNDRSIKWRRKTIESQGPSLAWPCRLFFFSLSLGREKKGVVQFESHICLDTT